MENKEPKKKASRPEELDEKLLASVSGGTADSEVEVLTGSVPLPEKDEQNLTCPVGAIVVE